MSTPTATSGSGRQWFADPAHLRALRYVAVALAAATAVLYALIAAGALTVLDGPAGEVARAQRAFGVPAAVAYALGVVLLARYDRWIVWVLGAALQMLAVAGYFNIASERSPAFETWGITIRVLQVLLLAVLVALAVASPWPRRGAVPPADPER